MPATERIELAAAIIGIVLFLSSELLSRSKCDANGITDLVPKALQELHTRSAGKDLSTTVPEP